MKARTFPLICLISLAACAETTTHRVVPAQLTAAIDEPAVPDPDATDTAKLGAYILDLVEWGRLGWSRLGTIEAVYGAGDE